MRRYRTKQALVSENPPTPAGERPLDRRARRTRDALGDALIALVHEKPFDEIRVQDVLERAGVSRSTFYAHFRDKDDLFARDVGEFYERVAMGLSERREPSQRVAPVREFFAHVAEAGPFRAALSASGRLRETLELGRAPFARGIERRLTELTRSAALTADERALFAQACAATLIAWLEAWLERGMPETPERMDELFHRFVWSGVGAGR